MLALIVGLVIFLGVHSTRLFAGQWRETQLRQHPLRWKGLYALIALVGLALVIWGYGQARMAPIWLWQSPIWTRHLAALLTVPAFILLAAAYIPGTRIKARVGHPMLLSVKFWALAHLLANGTVADVLLFGGFLGWAVILYIVLRRADRQAGIKYPVAAVSRDIAALLVGLAGWALFAFWLHRLWIGVAPFGG